MDERETQDQQERGKIDLSEKIHLLAPDRSPGAWIVPLAQVSRRERIGWKINGGREWLALRLAPWLRGPWD